MSVRNELTVVIDEKPVSGWGDERPDAAHLVAYQYLKGRTGKIIKDYVLSSEPYHLN